MYWRYWLIHIGLTLVKVLSFVNSSEVSSECTIASNCEVSDTRVLSRRKRYLIFPDGSSLQLVFCLQIAALIPIGDIFLFGDTVALAWNLPTDPELLTMFKDDLKKPEDLRRHDLHEIFYLKDGKVLARVPYERKIIVNPVFAKRSLDEQNMTFKEKLKLKLDRKKMHEEQEKREYLNQEHMTEKSVQFHRSSRIGLYEKLENLFTALRMGGRQCVLYKLCEAKRSPTRQGTFLQELSRIIFTLPKGEEFEKPEHRDYDTAYHHSNDECSTLYPDCDESVLYEEL